jgi:hypothetical protein
MAGGSPRELTTSGAVAPHLLEAVLSDAARRGAVDEVERDADVPTPPRASPVPPPPPRAARTVQTAPLVITPPKTPAPPAPAPELPELPLPPPSVTPPPITPAPSSVAPDVSKEDAGWFSLQVDSAEPPATAKLPSPPPPPPAAKLPFNTEVTPSVDRLWDKLTEGVFSDAGTLQGVGLPNVAPTEPALPEPPKAEPVRPSRPPEELDALANALTGESPSPPPVNATQVMTAVSVPAPAVEEAPAPPPPSRPSEATRLSLTPAPSRVSSLKSLPPSEPKPKAVVQPAAAPGSGLRTFLIFAVAFGAVYFAVSYFRQPSPAPSAPVHAPAPAPAAS